MKIKIVFEDDYLLVCHKPAGLATQTNHLGQTDLVSDVKNYIASKSHIKTNPYVGMIHRLDQPVEGIIVVAKTPQTASALSKQLSNHQMNKQYYAVVLNDKQIPTASRHTLRHQLEHLKRTNISQVVSVDNKEGKEAVLHFEVVNSLELQGHTISLFQITLVTGRHHQIRVQMSYEGFPLLGDVKYGNEESKLFSAKEGITNVALCAYQLSFYHPVTKKKQEFCINPSSMIFKKLLTNNC